MQDFALVVFPGFEDDGKQPFAHPANGQILFRDIRALVEPVRAGEQLPRLFKSDAALRVRPQPGALACIEAETNLVLLLYHFEMAPGRAAPRMEAVR